MYGNKGYQAYKNILKENEMFNSTSRVEWLLKLHLAVKPGGQQKGKN